MRKEDLEIIIITIIIIIILVMKKIARIYDFCRSADMDLPFLQFVKAINRKNLSVLVGLQK